MTTLTKKKAKTIKVGDVAALVYEGQKDFVPEHFMAAEVDYAFGQKYSIRIVWRAIDDAAKKLEIEYYPDDWETIVIPQQPCSHSIRRWLECAECANQDQYCTEVVCADCGESC
jgi:hypothetical protein